MKYNLPRSYLSWTQFSTWNRSHDAYRSAYYEEKGFTGNKYTAYGTEVHKMIENGKHPFTNLPTFEISEQKIECVIDDVPILSFIDGFSPSTGTIFELKTGKHPWTQRKVDEHGQLVFYAMAVRAFYGSHDPNVTLVWMQTQDVPCTVDIDGITWDATRPELTGDIKVFKRTIDNLEIVDFRRELVRTAQEIHDDYEDFRRSLILE